MCSRAVGQTGLPLFETRRALFAGARSAVGGGGGDTESGGQRERWVE